MPTLSPDDARRVGAELRRWSQRPISDTNARTLGLFGVLIVVVMVAAQNAPDPAAVVRGLSAVYFAMLASAHVVSLFMLRGLWRAGVAEAQGAMEAMRDPRRLSAFDMAMSWLMVGLVARWWE